MDFFKKMRDLCEKATKGKWKTEAGGAGVFAGSMLDKDNPVTLSISMYHKNACNDGLFIAAHSPDVMLKVWDVVQAASEAQMYGKGKEDFDKAMKALREHVGGKDEQD